MAGNLLRHTHRGQQIVSEVFAACPYCYYRSRRTLAPSGIARNSNAFNRTSTRVRSQAMSQGRNHTNSPIILGVSRSLHRVLR